MSNYSKYIPEDLAKELLELGMPLCRYNVMSFDSKPYFYEKAYKYDWLCWVRYQIPTYGEVIDWFSGWGIYLTFDVLFTFSLADNVGYIWKISYIDRSNDDIKLVTISEEDALDGKEGCGGSFELDAQSAIKYAMKLKKKI